MRRFHRKTMVWPGLSISLFLLLVLTACTPSQGRYTAMRTALDSINMLNKLTYRTVEIVIPFRFLLSLFLFKFFYFLVIHTFYKIESEDTCS